ncbi:MAG: hypothetical protein LBF64_04600 [Oscillospiraceae bacterium]|nr:hypothetical protein [Oscillospiraceae bacterium]
MKGKEITEILTNYVRGGVSFTFLRRSGLHYTFEVEGLEGEAAVTLAKECIRATEFGKVLYFSVAVDATN